MRTDTGGRAFAGPSAARLNCFQIREAGWGGVCRAGDAASRIFTALDSQGQRALRESARALEVAERRAAAAAALAQEAEHKVCRW